jgi:hypothetical protein
MWPMIKPSNFVGRIQSLKFYLPLKEAIQLARES